MFGKDMHLNERCETGDVEQICRVDVHRRVQRLMHGKARYVYDCWIAQTVRSEARR